MKTLRSKIFVFVSLLIILPALPLSWFVFQLLDQSYQVGVNERVEAALKGGLEISADLYQMHKSRLQTMLDKFVNLSKVSVPEAAKEIKTALPDAKFQFIKFEALEYNETLIPAKVINKFNRSPQVTIIWPGHNHKQLFALARIPQKQILQIEYPLPKSFRQSASQIKDVNQIYKTLSFARAEIRKSFLYTFLAIYLVVIIITLYVLFQLSRKITQPIERFTAATKAIGTGNLNYQIQITGHDEFAVLSSSFNRMVRELAENQKKIIALEQMAAWQQLARRLAHEIKNPLTPIQLMAQQMRDSYKESDVSYRKTLGECCEIIEEEVESLKKLVREFSDFARLPEFQIVKQDLRPLFETLRKLYSTANLRIDLPPNSLELNFDHEYLKRALVNLVDNALAASPAESEVVIVIEDKKDGFQIEITDHGAGIPPQSLNKIFRPYFSSKRSGVGLGLPIVKKIIEEHAGTINVESTVGVGTTFSIFLPKGKL
ncbi:MAG: ATP-binding protein [Methanosarcinaceae archaeon]